MRSLLVSTAAVSALAGSALTGLALTAGQPSAAPVSEQDTGPGRSGKPAKAEKRAEKAAAKAAKHAAQRAFVASKKEWTSCVAEAAPQGDADRARFDPEEACGAKPRNPRAADKTEGGGKDDKEKADHATRPPHAGGPGRRSEEPPGLAGKDRERTKDRAENRQNDQQGKPDKQDEKDTHGKQAKKSGKKEKDKKTKGPQQDGD